MIPKKSFIKILLFIMIVSYAFFNNYLCLYKNDINLKEKEPRLLKGLICFTLYGNNTYWTIGAIKNAETMIYAYYGSRVLYFVDNDTVPMDIVNELLVRNSSIIFLNEEIMQKNGFNISRNAYRVWRFFGADIKDWDFILFRDTDSRITLRELSAVGEWLQSSYGFHTFKDHPDHQD